MTTLGRWRGLLLKLLMGISVVATGAIHAFPEMIRHGYPQCASCHVSPSGGGILNAYGRVQADELLAMYPLNRTPDESPINFGAQLRVLQTEVSNAKSFRRAFILMQADVEAAGTYKQYGAVASLGAGTDARPVSRRHYGIYRPTGALTLRAGRFTPLHGLGLPDHALEVREGFGPGEEPYAVEASLTYEAGNTFVTAMRDGFILRQAFNVGNSQLGVTVSDNSIGPFGVVSISQKLFVLGESRFVREEISAYGRVAYELHKGLLVYVGHAHERRSFTGIGIQLFPVSGVELRGEFDQYKEGYAAWAMMNLWI